MKMKKIAILCFVVAVILLGIGLCLSIFTKADDNKQDVVKEEIEEETRQRLGMEHKYHVSYDLWEMHEGIHLYSLASIYAAFENMINIYNALGKDVSEFENNRLKEEKINKTKKRLEKLQLGIKEYINNNLYDKDSNSYLRNTEDKKMDISMIGAVTPFNIFKPKEKKIVNTVEKINLTLRTYTGGYQRFEQDHYMNGNPWPIANLWMTLYYLETGEKRKAKETTTINKVKIEIKIEVFVSFCG